MFQNLHVYIDLNWEDYVNDPSHFFAKTIKVINLAYLHKCTVYVFKEDLEIFVENCTVFEEYFLDTIGDKLDILLENAIKVKKECFAFSINYLEAQSTLIPQNRFSILQNSRNRPISLISLSLNPVHTKLLAIHSNQVFYQFDINIFNAHEPLIDWISENGIPRVFNLSPKHGVNGTGNWPNASPLLCSKDVAESLLKKAIADLAVINKLFNFDLAFNTFIEFYYEGNNPQNQWHGFHIKESEWKKRVPNSILKYFNKL